MRCPYCNHEESKVIDSRESKNGMTIRRRRECLDCEKRFTTYEKIEEIPYMIVKKDGRRQRFESEKIMAGLLKACEKRPISMQQMEELVDKIEYTLQSKFDKEVEASAIGELLMEFLYELDEVAYVRFASVYRQFKDINQFMKELRGLLNHK